VRRPACSTRALTSQRMLYGAFYTHAGYGYVVVLLWYLRSVVLKSAALLAHLVKNSKEFCEYLITWTKYTSILLPKPYGTKIIKPLIIFSQYSIILQQPFSPFPSSPYSPLNTISLLGQHR